MANRVPLIVDPVSAQVKELPAVDDLSLEGSSIVGINTLDASRVAIGLTNIESSLSAQIQGITKIGIGTTGYQFPTNNTGIGSQFLALDPTGTNLIFTIPAGEVTGAAGSQGQIQYNNSDLLLGANIWFTVGSGTTIGRTGINTSNPLRTFDVNGDINYTGNLYLNNSSFIQQTLGKTGVTISGNIINTGIVSFTSSVFGTSITASSITTDTMTANTYTTPSDKTLKKNIKKIDNSLEKISKINGVSFEWKNNSDKCIGLIAQEVEEIFPEMIKVINGKKHINYDALIAVLIESVKELKSQMFSKPINN